jgi:hypothetical protein
MKNVHDVSKDAGMPSKANAERPSVLKKLKKNAPAFPPTVSETPGADKQFDGMIKEFTVHVGSGVNHPGSNVVTSNPEKHTPTTKCFEAPDCPCCD